MLFIPKESVNMTKEMTTETVQNVLNQVKKNKEDKGVIPADNKKIIITGNANTFKGKSLKITKGLFKNGRNYKYPAGTKWEDIDNFGRINISFSKADFN